MQRHPMPQPSMGRMWDAPRSIPGERHGSHDRTRKAPWLRSVLGLRRGRGPESEEKTRHPILRTLASTSRSPRRTLTGARHPGGARRPSLREESVHYRSPSRAVYVVTLRPDHRSPNPQIACLRRPHDFGGDAVRDGIGPPVCPGDSGPRGASEDGIPTPSVGKRRVRRDGGDRRRESLYFSSTRAAGASPLIRSIPALQSALFL